MSVETREKIKLATIVSIAALVFSIAGTIAANSFIAGSYAEKVTANAIETDLLKKDLKEHEMHSENTYVKKEVFEESVRRRDQQFEDIKESLKEIKELIRR